MPVLNFTPHWLWTQDTEGYEDAKGNYHAGSGKWKKYLKCDIVPAGQAKELPLPDGSTRTYTYVIHVYDRKCRDFELGELIRLTRFGKDDGREYEVVGFHRYQLQCKIWV